MLHATIKCSAVVEEFSQVDQTVRKQTTLKEANVSAVRDNYGQIMLRISPFVCSSTGPNNSTKSVAVTKKQRSVGYPVIQLDLFKSFLKEGKATVRLPAHNVQVLLSNCPPDALRLFLGTLRAKWKVAVMEASKKGTKILSERARLNREPSAGTVSTSLLEEVSPLRRQDVVSLQRNSVNKYFVSTPTIAANDCKKRRINNPAFSPSVPNISPVTQSKPTTTPVRKRPSQMTSTPVRTSKSNLKPLAQSPSSSKPSASRGSQLYGALTEEQCKVLETVRSGRNVFYTGSAGTGKSFLTKKIIGLLPPAHTVVTASTGVAACQIGGRTLHNFAGIGKGSGSLDACFSLASRPAVARGWRQCKHLIVDEISLVDADLFTKLDQVARHVRAKPDKPFGGIQLILCGDFFQLPPVQKLEDQKGKLSGTSGIQFAFKSESWSEAIDVVVELTRVYRQSHDKAFIDILQRVRVGQCSPDDSRLLRETGENNLERDDGIVATKLTTHRHHVDSVNKSQLQNLTGEAKVFSAQDSDPGLSSKMDMLCPAPSHLTLKVGAQVMLVKNLDVSKGLANGARGVVKRFLSSSEGGYPVVHFVTGNGAGVDRTITPDRWTISLCEGGMTSSRNQLPITLAWALSVHKSQGMTLDWVQLHLSKVFECGQAYVALSRCRSLTSMRVVDWNPSCVRADPDVLAFYKSVRERQREEAQDARQFQENTPF